MERERVEKENGEECECRVRVIMEWECNERELEAVIEQSEDWRVK